MSWEDLTYDSLYRLDTVQRNGAETMNLDYDAIGNITRKTDVSANQWTYHTTKKHAVTAAGSNTYAYDANGNMTTRNGATVTWFSYNLPNTINQSGGNYSQFSYGAHRQRYKQVNKNGSITETTIYVGGVFEKLTRSTGAIEYKHYIVGDGQTVAVVNRKSGGTTETFYPLSDHLGSTDKLTNSAGTILASLSYDAFGKRRGSNWTGSPSSGDQTTVSNTTRDGFTNHEHLDNLGLIHMNGRVFDPVIGRFMSADPFVQAPFNSQSLNRYSYTFNNPLKHTDPSGFGTVESCTEGQDADACDTEFTSGDDDSSTWTLPSDAGDTGTTFDIGSGVGISESLDGGFDASGGGSGDSRRSESTVGGTAQSPSAQRTADYLEAGLSGDWLGALGAGLGIVRGEWQDAYSTPEGALLTTMSMVPIVGVEAAVARGALAAPRQIAASWGASLYRHGGLMTGIEHIMYRHGFKSGFAGVSRFAQGTRIRDISNYVDSALRYGRVSATYPGAYMVEYNVGRAIGTDIAGNAVSNIRLYIRDGIIQTAFPF